jgi:methyl-accepting chemotaxis protein
MKTVTSATDKILESCELVLRASKEQSTGIRQVSIAVESLNRATQGNAGNAEKSADASQNLAELSTHLQEHVSDLQFIIHGLREVKPVEMPHRNVVSFKAKAPVHQPSAPVRPLKKAAGASPRSSGSTPGGWDKL